MALVVQSAKDPDAELEYGFDWSDWLVGDDTIVDSSWAVGAGVTKESDSFTTTASVVRVSGGTAGQKYDLINTVTTADGLIVVRTLTLPVEQR